MPLGDTLVFTAQTVFAVVILAGLAHRRRFAGAHAFAAYLVTVALFSGLTVAWPEIFWTWPAWLFRETVQAVVKLAVVLELLALIYEPFPGARASARAWLALLGLGLLAVVLYASAPSAVVVAQVVMPKVSYGTAMLFGALLGAALWWHIPLDPLHKAILVGFTAYLVAFTGIVAGFDALGWGYRPAANVLNPAAYLALLAWWTRVAWAPVTIHDGVAPEVAQRLHPWLTEKRP